MAHPPIVMFWQILRMLHLIITVMTTCNIFACANDHLLFQFLIVSCIMGSLIMPLIFPSLSLSLVSIFIAVFPWYFRWHLVSDGRQATGSPMSVFAREVPSDPCIHDGRDLGASSRWWYIPAMYNPSHSCPRCMNFQPQTAGQVLTAAMRERTALAEANLARKPISLVSDLYRIPRDGFRDQCTWSPHNVWWPHLENGEFSLTATSGMSLLSLSETDKLSLRIVIVEPKVQAGIYWRGSMCLVWLFYLSKFDLGSRTLWVAGVGSFGVWSGANMFQLSWHLVISSPSSRALPVPVLDLKYCRWGVSGATTRDQSAYNPLKVGLSTAKFVDYDIVKKLPSPEAMAAFTFLKAHNKWYAHYYEEQHGLIRAKAAASEFRIKTFDLMVKRQGIECAAFPWLYPMLGRAPWLFSQIEYFIVFFWVLYLLQLATMLHLVIRVMTRCNIFACCHRPFPCSILCRVVAFLWGIPTSSLYRCWISA